MMKSFHKNFFKILSLVLLLILLVIGLFYAYNLYFLTKSKDSKIDPAIEKISKFMVLPSEAPQITTIDNIEQVKQRDAAFFKDAQIGDKLIAYQYLAILFDPQKEKIKNVQSFTPPPPTPSVPLRMSFRYNGNEESRVNNLKTQLEQTSPFYVISEVVKSKVVYKDDVIYLINPARREDVANFAKSIGGSSILTDLEPNENTTDADLIVAFRDIE